MQGFRRRLGNFFLGIAWPLNFPGAIDAVKLRLLFFFYQPRKSRRLAHVTGAIATGSSTIFRDFMKPLHKRYFLSRVAGWLAGTENCRKFSFFLFCNSLVDAYFWFRKLYGWIFYERCKPGIDKSDGERLVILFKHTPGLHTLQGYQLAELTFLFTSLSFCFLFFSNL